MVLQRCEKAEVGELPKSLEIVAYRPRFKCNFPQIAAARKGVQMNEELNNWVALLPGLELRFERMKADLLGKLRTQPRSVAERLVVLRATLHSAYEAAIATSLPSHLTSLSPEEFTAAVQSIRCALQTPCGPG
jgi:hypothetical protein